MAHASATCSLEPGAPTSNFVHWMWPNAWTSLSWRIPACAACPQPSALQVTSVQFALGNLGTCTATAQVSIVAAGGDAACPSPDTTQILCGPFTYPLSGPAHPDPLWVLSLPPGCCVSPGAFVVVKFGVEACGEFGRPTPSLLLSDGPNASCSEYVTVSGFYPTFTDVNSIFPGGHPLWIRADAECCGGTPTLPPSWGGVKTLYR